MHPIFHFIIPIILLRILRVDKRIILLLAPLTVIQDLDAFTGLHRALLHSMPSGIILIACAFLLIKLFSAQLNKVFPGLYLKGSSVLLIGFFMHIMHIILDYGKVALLWPFSSRVFDLSLNGISYLELGGFQISNFLTLRLFAQILLIIIISGLLCVEGIYLSRKLHQPLYKPAEQPIEDKEENTVSIR